MVGSNAEPTLTLHGGAAAGLAQAARELNENLAALQALLRELVDQASQKLTAMRTVDVDGLTSSAAREGELLAQVQRVAQQREAILARAAQDMPDAAGPVYPLSRLLEKIPEPYSSALRARNAALQRVAADLQEKNATVAAVAQSLQSHIRAVFTELAKVNVETVIYGPKGQHEPKPVRTWIDAVG